MYLYLYLYLYNCPVHIDLSISSVALYKFTQIEALKELSKRMRMKQFPVIKKQKKKKHITFVVSKFKLSPQPHTHVKIAATIGCLSPSPISPSLFFYLSLSAVLASEFSFQQINF